LRQKYKVTNWPEYDKALVKINKHILYNNSQ
jgi:hypothetical protein